MAPGNYPPQTLKFDPKKTGANVIFRPAAGGEPRIDSGLFPADARSNLILSGAGHVTFEGLRIVGELRIVPNTGSKTRPETRFPEQIAFLGGRIDGFFTIRGVNGLTFDGTVIGNYILRDGNPDTSGVPRIGYYPGQPDARNMVFRRVRFENIVRPPGTRTHGECLFLDAGVDGLKIVESRFTNCAVFDIFAFRSGRAPSNVTIENTWLDAPRDSEGRLAPTAIAFKSIPNPQPVATNWKIRFNSLRGNILFKCEPGNGCESAFSNIVVSSNVGWNGSGTCPQPGTQGVIFEHNVWSGRPCSSSDKRGALGFVASEEFDFRLVRGAPAIGFGAKEGGPPTDIAGRKRPRTLAPDAGAWQREPALVVSGRSIGTAATTMSRAEIVAFYGASRKRSKLRLPDGTRVISHAYPMRGGRLTVTYRDDEVVAISTTSAYYETDRGLGPGDPLRPRKAELASCRPVGGSCRQGKALCQTDRRETPSRRRDRRRRARIHATLRDTTRLIQVLRPWGSAPASPRIARTTSRSGTDRSRPRRTRRTAACRSTVAS